MDTESLQRIDSFPYRHRLSELMSTPVASAAGDLPVGEAARLMDRRRVSSLLVLGAPPASADGAPIGIITERDVLTALARDGAAALDRPIAAYMSSPVATVPAESLVYQALGRMDRLGIRHLAVVDGDGRAVGMITAGRLLKQRAGSALALGDELAAAPDAGSMAAIRDRLPQLAADLLREQLTPLDVASVISAVMRDLTGRAVALAEAEMADAGRGTAPAPWSVMILGSGGRGESLLAPDQDNALIHGGSTADDPWFQEFAARFSRILDEAGVPYCKGGVMASRPAWRGDQGTWRKRIAGWVRNPSPKHLLNVDIFFDFMPVAGDRQMAEGLRAEALAEAAGSFAFLKLLSAELESYRAPLRPFGRFVLRDGRLDLKMGGLFPIVAGIRTLALRHAIPATATAARLDALRKGGHLRAADGSALGIAHQLLVGLILRQQITDLAAGRPASNAVDPAIIGRGVRPVLRDMLRRLEDVPAMVQDSLVAR